MGRKRSADSAKRIVRTVALSLMLTGIRSGMVLAAKRIYDSCFQRYEKKDIADIYGEFDYSRVRETADRILLDFPSDRTRLQGYYYPCDNAKALVVVCHGMHAGADDYLPIIIYFIKNGFAVFAYDCKGTYASGGNSTVGMCTPLVDLDNALRYISNDPTLSALPLLLFGHSWGGYAVTSVLSIQKNVRACAAIAPFNDGLELILEKSRQYAGPFVDTAKQSFPSRFLRAYQRLLFGGYTELDAVSGINRTDVPVFIAHGSQDRVISFDGQSVISHKNEIRKENVVYYVGTGEQSGHNSILHSRRALAYQEKIRQELKQLKKESSRELSHGELVGFCDSIDHALYSEVNTEMMDRIVNLFEASLKPN